MITNAFATCRTLAAIATQNWIRVRPTSVAMEPNAHLPAISWISPVLASWATLADCAMKTLTSALFRHLVVTEPHVKIPTDLTFVFAPKATKAVIV